MKKGRKVTAREKVIFPLVAAMVIILLVPACAPLIAMFMLGNLFRESKVVERLNETSQNALMNIVTIFLGISIGASMNAENFLRKEADFYLLWVCLHSASVPPGILVASS
jgi:oxaloacetate decarboxylase beta subunit